MTSAHSAISERPQKSSPESLICLQKRRQQPKVRRCDANPGPEPISPERSVKAQKQREAERCAEAKHRTRARESAFSVRFTYLRTDLRRKNKQTKNPPPTRIAVEMLATSAAPKSKASVRARWQSILTGVLAQSTKKHTESSVRVSVRFFADSVLKR